ncbi:hypothetical protein ACFODL_19470 [Phenylobacterium terrae]|uniref:Uncharacterized protein n=1 Tax=Phenylobacterium terrae TaxID=2665495 RepID=A0ABW4N3N3_9CAUL
MAVLSWLGLTRSELRTPYPGPATVQLDIRPFHLPPRAPSADLPAPLRPLRPRTPRRPDEADDAVPPLHLPTAAQGTRAPPAAAPALPELGRALRGRLGCDEAARLSREERDRCAERLGARRAEGPDYGPAAGIAPLKRAAFDRAAGVSPLPPEPEGVAPEGSDNIGDPDYGGGMAAEMGAPHHDSSRATRVTPRLPP